jgi:ketosteroid isomerase-like protein
MTDESGSTLMTSAVSTTDRNRDIVRNFYDAGTRGAFDELGQYLADSYTLTQSAGHPVPGHWAGPDAASATGVSCRPSG